MVEIHGTGKRGTFLRREEERDGRPGTGDRGRSGGDEWVTIAPRRDGRPVTGDRGRSGGDERVTIAPRKGRMASSCE